MNPCRDESPFPAFKCSFFPHFSGIFDIGDIDDFGDKVFNVFETIIMKVVDLKNSVFKWLDDDKLVPEESPPEESQKPNS